MVTKIVLLILFYSVIFPIGLISRITGKDRLRRKIESESPTYWEEW